MPVTPAPPVAPNVAPGKFPGDQNVPVLQRAVEVYRGKFKRLPAQLNDLVKEGFLPAVPFPPPGMRYELDAVTGEVKLINPLAK